MLDGNDQLFSKKISKLFLLREVRKENNNENVRSAVESDRLPFSSASHTFPSEQFQVY